MKYSNKELQFIIQRLSLLEYDLSEWEVGFVNSVAPRIAQGLPLSDKQMSTLSKIWDKVPM